MKRGFRGVPRPLFPAMLPVVAVDQSAGPADQAEDQPSSSAPLPSSSHHLQDTTVPQSQDPTHPHVSEARTMTVEDLLHLVPNLITKVDSLETELKQTKLTMGNAIVKLVKKVKKLKESKGKDIDSGFEDISTGFEEVNTGGLRVSTGSGPVSSARGQREGKAPMIVEENQAPKRTKEQIQQEEATQHYSEEDWDAIRAKLEANAELTKSVLGKELPEEDFVKKMVELVNQRKKFFAEERAKSRRSKPMTQSQLRNYMMNYLKNQGTWKLTQLKKLSFEEVKEEFDKLVKQVESFVPMNIEATKAQLKRYGEKLQTKISKKQTIDDKDVSDEEKVTEVKEEESVKRTGKRKKQKARKEAMNPTPLDTKSNIVANWKIFQQDERSIYQIIRANGADTVYMSFGAMLKDFTREDLIELYRLVMQKYGTNRPEDVYDRVLWSDLRTMFDPPLNEDDIWSLPLQQKMISWRYYDKCAVHCLTLEACNIYMLADRMIEKQAGVKK
ncbi:hypothetical protein Tco_1415276 [Tanacetum coccineum]